MKIHHLGIAVESLAQAVPDLSEACWEKLLMRKRRVADQKVRVAAFRLGDSRLELLEGTEGGFPYRAFHRQTRPGNPPPGARRP